MPRTNPGGSAPPGAPGGAAPAGAPGAPSAPSPGADIFAAAANKKLSESSGTDPEHVVNVLREMKATIAALIPKVAFRMSGVDKHLNPAYRSIDNALQEAMKAMQQIAAQKPIEFSAAAGGPGPTGPPAQIGM